MAGSKNTHLTAEPLHGSSVTVCGAALEQTVCYSLAVRSEEADPSADTRQGRTTDARTRNE